MSSGAALVASGVYRHTTKLDLSYNRIGDAGARALAESPLLAGLTKVDLSCNQIGPEGAMRLATSPHLTELTSLKLDDNRLGLALDPPHIGSQPDIARLLGPHSPLV